MSSDDRRNSEQPSDDSPWMNRSPSRSKRSFYLLFQACKKSCYLIFHGNSCDIIFQDHGTFFSKIVLPFFQGGVIFFSKVVLFQGDVYYSFPTSKKLLFKNHLKNAS